MNLSDSIFGSRLLGGGWGPVSPPAFKAARSGKTVGRWVRLPRTSAKCFSTNKGRNAPLFLMKSDMESVRERDNSLFTFLNRIAILPVLNISERTQSNEFSDIKIYSLVIKSTGGENKLFNGHFQRYIEYLKCGLPESGY